MNIEKLVKEFQGLIELRRHVREYISLSERYDTLPPDSLGRCLVDGLKVHTLSLMKSELRKFDE